MFFSINIIIFSINIYLFAVDRQSTGHATATAPDNGHRSPSSPTYLASTLLPRLNPTANIGLPGCDAWMRLITRRRSCVYPAE